jgi:hypothetical protein
MTDLPQHALALVSGPAWEPLRSQFIEIGQSLSAAAAEARCDSLGKYVKFTIDASPGSPTYAAIWLKSSAKLVVGLALPETYKADEFGPPLLGTTYKGLTKYLTVERGGSVPERLAEWGRLAYCNAASPTPQPEPVGG